MTEPRPTDDHTGRLIADFNAMAATYDTLRHAQACARRLVDLMALPPGAQVLDIATGTGLAAFAALQCVGPTGTVVGVDIAPEMVEYAQQKAAAAGLTNVAFRLGDAAQLDEPAVRFDVALCASGLFFMPDMLAALREWWRVLKPGGQVGFSGWGPTYQQPLLGLWHARLHQYGVPPPHRSADPTAGGAHDVSAAPPRGGLCGGRGTERATGLLSPKPRRVVGADVGEPESHGRVRIGPGAARAISGGISRGGSCPGDP
jgi:ubiquinone/menaquinone biosynthesis C-methylase UbiE